MSKAVYVGLSDKARKVKKMYIGVDGVARKVKKGYIGVNGVARLFYSGHTFVSYSGDYIVTPIVDNGVRYELYTLTTSGTLVLDDTVSCWLCGGGGGGASGRVIGTICSGGGGGGGYVNSGELGSGSHVVTIGAGGAKDTDGGATTAGDLTADGGKTGYNAAGGDGGSGGGGGDYTISVGSWGNGAGVSTYPFGLASLKAHCAGGAGGFYTIERGAGNGGSNGSNGCDIDTYDTSKRQGLGGEYGGGNGGKVKPALSTSQSATSDMNASFYGGGGGGGGYESSSRAQVGGSGYQGVVYLLIETKSAPKPAEIITQPTNATGVVGDTVSFTVEATGVASYMWQYGSNGTKFYDLPTGDSRYVGVTSPTAEIQMTNSSVNWYYRCKLTGEDGNVVYTDVVHVESSEPIVITKQPTDVYSHVGATISFSVEATGESLTYDWWYSNDGSTFNRLATSSNPTSWTYDQSVLIFYGSKNRFGYYFHCVITDANGNTVTTDTVTLYNIADA